MIVAGYFGGWSLLGPIGVTVSSGLVTSRTTLLATCTDGHCASLSLGFADYLIDLLRPEKRLLAG